jgi:hypothetical protein
MERPAMLPAKDRRPPAAMPDRPNLERNRMVTQFAVGNHVRWNSEAGYVEGVIVKIHTHDVEYKGYMHHATEGDPQYEIKSDKTDHVAMHKGSALTKL